ncbi:MAG: LamG-like jellyroll fold domain-containing protein [Ignavibacteriaceae bacterium]|jgi:photosystem II stability/assembly factor-like uncharacterized protein
MKKLSFLFGLFFFANTFIFTQTWTQQTSGTTNILNSVCFINENYGWAVGSPYSVNETTILRTTDGGLNWIKNLNITSSYSLQSVFFVNQLTGWTVGDAGIILKTTDGGINWFQQNSSNTHSLNTVYFLNDQIGWAAGDKLLKTTDGGNNWTVQDKFFRQIQFLNSQIGFGVSGGVSKTTDGGQTWNSLSTIPTTTDYKNLYFLSTEVGIVVGSQGYDPIIRTTDGGQTWTSITNQPGCSLWDVGFVNQLNGWAVGNLSGAGKIVATTDGGISWEVQHTATNFLYGVSFPNENNGWAVGNGGTILKYSGNTSSSGITVTSPNGGENVTVGSTQNITWTSSNVSNVMIEYTTNNGSNWFSLGSSYPASSGSFSVIVPNTPSTQCKVKVSDVSNSSISDMSDNVFTISTGTTTGGLIAYYPFNGNANDESGNGRNGVVYGASLTTDRFGNPDKAYQFNGTSNYIDIPGTNNLHLNTNGLSLAAWINFTEPNDIHAIVGKHISGYGNGYYLMIRPATKFEFLVDSDFGLRSTESYNDGNWHFVVGTFDGSTMKLYVDGALKSSQPKTYSSLNDSTLTIGKHHAGVATDFFNGKLDDIRIFDKAISETEVLQLFNDGINLNQGLVVHYPFNGNTNDESGNGKHGVKYGATLTTDRFGNPDKAFQFNGTSDYIDIPGTNNLHLNSTGLTLAAWINFTEPNDIHAIVGKHISGYGNGYYLMIRLATKIEFLVDSDFGLRTTESYNDGKWHFVVGTFDGSMMKLYINGELKSSQTKTYSSMNDSTVTIGKHHTGVAADFFNGKLDDIRIYNRPITELELSALYNQKIVGIEENTSINPVAFSLKQNYPNPFNPTTSIQYAVGGTQFVSLKVYDVLGNEVATLVNEEKQPGVYNYELGIRNYELSSGVYFYQLRAGGFVQTKKMIVLK